MVERLRDKTEEAQGAVVAQKGKPKQDRMSRMATGSIPRLITEFAIPSIAGMLVNSAYNLIDSIFLGQKVGELGLAATTVAMPIMTIFMALAMLVGVGGNALAALKLGEGKRDVAEKILGNSITLSIIVWAIMLVASSIPAVMDALLSLSSATPEVRPAARTFITIIFHGFILQSIGMGTNNFIRTAGAPNRALMTMVVGAIACIFFNYLFVMVLELGVAGSAYATVCGQGVSCISVLWYFIFTKNVPLKLRLRNMRPEWRLCGAMVSLGAASFVLQVGGTVTSLANNYLLVKYGALHPIGSDAALASIGLVMRVTMFAIVPLVGMAVAIQPLIGFNYGAKLLRRVRTTLLDGMLAAVSIGVVLWVVIHLWPEQIVSVFGINDPDLMDFTVFALKVQVFALPVVGIQIIGSNYFQATGQPLKSIILTMTRQILFLLPLMFTMPDLLPRAIPSLTGLDVLYMCTPAADVLAIVVTLVFVARELGRMKRRIAVQEGGVVASVANAVQAAAAGGAAGDER